MSYDARYNRPGNRNRRPLYAPPPSRGNQSHHSVLGYWVPLVITGTIALGGLAAWIWSERHENDEDEYPHDKPPRPPTGHGAPYPAQGSQPYPGSSQSVGGGLPPYQGPPPSQSAGPQGGPPPAPVGGEAASYYGTAQTNLSREAAENQHQQDENTWYGRVSGVMKRTPSPQQFFDSASKQVSAGIAAAGSALGSIMEDDPSEGERRRDKRGTRSGERRAERRERREEREGFSDHERWSEEADERRRVGVVEAESERRADAARTGREGKGKGRAPKAVAVVVSAESATSVVPETDMTYRTEHASILSHLPSHHDPETTDLFVLIYAPDLKTLPPLNYEPSTSVPSNLGSSYSGLNTPAVTPGSEHPSMADDATAPSPTFAALYQQALALVSSPTHILPFTTPDGYVHILRHLAPALAYVSDSVSGEDGALVEQLTGWVGHTVLVAGDEGHGGLADTETETEDERDPGRRERKRWYERSSFVGLGKPVEVVDAGRVGEDWGKRVGGRE